MNLQVKLLIETPGNLEDTSNLVKKLNILLKNDPSINKCVSFEPIDSKQSPSFQKLTIHRKESGFDEEIYNWAEENRLLKKTTQETKDAVLSHLVKEITKNY
jgi:hypothetical protein